MALPDKTISLTTKTRNRWAPRSDRLIAALAFTETAEAPFDDDGLGTAHQTAIPALSPWVNYGVTGTSYIDDETAYAPYVQYAGGTDATYFGSAAFPSTTTSASGTLAICFRLDEPPGTAYKTIFSTGQGQQTGRLRIMLSKSNDPENPGGLTVNSIGLNGPQKLFIPKGAIDDLNAWHVVVVTWGARGLTAYIDTLESKLTDATAVTPAEFAANKYLLFGKGTGTGTPLAWSVSGVWIWDVQLGDADVLRILEDPWICSRPAPASADVFATQAGPEFSRATEDSVTASLTTGLTAPLAADTINWRIRYGVDPMNLSDLAVGAGISTVSDIATPIDIVLSELTPNTRHYARCEWTVDGTIWQPMPVGLCEFYPKRTDEAAYTSAFITDPHTGVASEGGIPDTINNGYGVELFLSSSGSRKHYAAWRTMTDVIQYAVPEFVIWGGDTWFLDVAADPGKSDINSNMLSACATFRNFWAPLLARSVAYYILGNHEAELHYQQNANAGDDVAAQKQATIARKRFFHNPIPTTNDETAIFGENEGAPVTNSTLSWLPGDIVPFSNYLGGYVGYLTDYVIDAGGENASPLQNYAAFSHGGGNNKLLVALCDILRYPAASGVTTAAGDPNAAIGTGGEHKRSTGELASFGARQFTQLQRLLRTVQAAHKLVCTHNLPGGTGIGITTDNDFEYFRGNNLNVGEARQQLRDLAKETNVNAVLLGHDHRFCHRISDTVAVVTGPTAGAPSHTANDGWADFNRLNAEYGTPASRGEDLPTGVGLGTASGIRRSLNIIGYLKLQVAGGRLSYEVRQTELAREIDVGTGALSNVLRPGVERFTAPVSLRPSGDTIQLTGEPRDVGAIYLDSDVTPRAEDWWTFPPEDQKVAAVGPYEFDEDIVGNVIGVASGLTAKVRPLTVPRTVFSSVLRLGQQPGEKTNVEYGLSADNRAAEDFEANDLGDPVQLPPELSPENRARNDFVKNTITYPGGVNFDTKLQPRP